MLERIKGLFKNQAIYGMGDVATSLVSLLLLPLFTKYLSPADYGFIALLLTIEAITKVAFKWGVDTAFMRLYFDCPDQPARQRLASTLFFFLALANGALLALGILGLTLFMRVGSHEHWLLIVLTLVNTYVAGFYFIPYQALRIAERSRTFIALTFTRSAGTIVARLVFVIALGWGVRGVVLSDITVTTIFTFILLPVFAPLIRPVFSRSALREALRFGLPRIPHSIAQQVIGYSDRYFLQAFGTLADLGIYSVSATFGLALKLFLSSFESAWTPFFLAVMGQRDAKHTYRVVSTYVLAALVLLVAGLSATAPAIVGLFTQPKFHAGAAVIPWIAIGVMCQGIYLVGSIGLIITKRTKIYPFATGVAAVASVLSNWLLIPRFGFIGAAWANAIAYAMLALVTVGASWWVYPISYEWTRLLRVAVAGLASFALAARLVPASVWPVAGLLARGTIVVVAYLAILAMTGFFHVHELRWVQDVVRRARLQGVVTFSPADQTVEMAGEMLGASPEINADVMKPGAAASEPDESSVSRDSQSPRR